jgi:hypothetical protein
MIKQKAEPAAPTSDRRMVPSRIVFRWQSMRREIETIRRYIETVTSSFEQEFKSYTAYLEKQAEDTPDHLIESLAEDYAEAESHLLKHFPAFALHTTFVASYSLLEDQMLEIGRIVGRHLNVNLEPEDLWDKGIHAAKKYLEKLCGINVPNGRPWEEVVHYGKLRNVCMHSRGRVKETNSDVRKYVAKKTSITINDYNHLEFTKTFCLEALDNIEELLNALYELARDRDMEAMPQSDA